MFPTKWYEKIQFIETFIMFQKRFEVSQIVTTCPHALLDCAIAGLGDSEVLLGIYTILFVHAGNVRKETLQAHFRPEYLIFANVRYEFFTRNISHDFTPTKMNKFS